MLTLRQAGMMQVAAGLTSFEEILPRRRLRPPSLRPPV